MKKIPKITLLLLLVTAFSLSTACSGPFSPESEGSQPSVPAEQAAFLRVSAAGITTRAAGAPDSGTDDERKADVLHLYFYRTDDNRLVAARDYIPATGATFPYTVSVPAEVIHAGPVYVRVLSSPGVIMPDAPERSNFGEETIPGMRDERGELTYITDDRHLPMTSGEITADFQKPVTAPVSLTRAVAKLRVRVVEAPDMSGTITLHRDAISLRLENLRISGTLLPSAEVVPGLESDRIPVSHSQIFQASLTPGTPNAFVPETTTNGTTQTEWMHTAYVNEHLFPATGAPTSPMQLNLNLPYTEGGLREDENRYILPLDFSIVRNRIYHVTITVFGGGTGPVVARLNSVVTDWTGVDQSGGI